MNYDPSDHALSWEESQEYQERIQHYAVKQAVNLYKKFKDDYKEDQDIKFGEEIEYHVCTFDEQNQVA